MIVSLIAAVASNGVIGKDNGLLWHLPADMKYFKRVTTGHCILTGRRSYESIPPKYRPLKDRTNIVVTRQPGYGAGENIQVVHSIARGLELARDRKEQEIFVIGGGEIYSQTIQQAHRLYITEVKADFEGDTYFPSIIPENWEEYSRIIHKPDSKHAQEFHFTVLERVR